MKPKNGRMLQITMGVAGVALLAASVLGPAQGRERRCLTVDRAVQALVYGRADASWTRRAAELVASDGEAAGVLGHVAGAAHLDGVARGRALDALALAGGPAAQEAMRDALSSPSLHADAAYPMLVARLAGVAAPTVETLIYLGQLRQEAVATGQIELAEASTPACHLLRQARTPLGRRR